MYMLFAVYRLQGHTVYHCLYIITCIKFLVLVKALWLKSNPCLSRRTKDTDTYWREPFNMETGRIIFPC